MKEMIRQFHMRRDELALLFAVQAGFFLFGEIILGIMVFFTKSKDSIIPLGSVMALTGAVFLMIFVEMSAVPMCFNISVSMGAVRTRVIPALLGMSIIENLAAGLFAQLLHLIEQGMFRVIYTGVHVEAGIEFLFRWKYLLVAGLAVAAVSSLFGAMSLKFRKASAVLFWLLWMLVFAVGPRIGKLLESGKDGWFLRLCREAVRVCQSLSEAGMLAAAVMLSAGMMLAAWLLLHKQRVEI